MNCVKCYSYFDKSMNIPKMLPNCDHSICDKCLNIYLKTTEFNCPECSEQYINPMIDQFPINQTLISLMGMFDSSLICISEQKYNTKKSINNPSEKSNLFWIIIRLIVSDFDQAEQIDCNPINFKKSQQKTPDKYQTDSIDSNETTFKHLNTVKKLSVTFSSILKSK